MFMVLVVIAGRGKMADDIPHFPQVKVDRSLVASYTAEQSVTLSGWNQSQTHGEKYHFIIELGTVT